MADETLRRVELAHHLTDLGDLRLHCVEAGEGPLALLVDGLPQFWYQWRHQVPALVESGFRVVAPDMRGYNLPDKPSGLRAYRVELLARDVERLILACGKRTADVVGHDWGAIAAWVAAMRYPGRVGRLAILNGPHPDRLLEGLMGPMHRRDPGADGTPKILTLGAASSTSHEFMAEGPSGRMGSAQACERAGATARILVRCHHGETEERDCPSRHYRSRSATEKRRKRKVVPMETGRLPRVRRRS